MKKMFVHARGLCDSENVGHGTRIWAFAHVMSGAVVGSNCNIGEGAFVESGASLGDRVTLKNHVLVWNGVRIEDDVFVGPGVIFTNDRRPRSARMEWARDRYRDASLWMESTVIGRGASLGAGAVILCGLTVGEFAFVAAGSLVTRSVAPHRLVLGRPARARGWVCRCGAALDKKLRCRECSVSYRRVRNGLLPLG